LGFVGGGQVCGFPAVSITGFTGNVLGGATGTFDTSGISRWRDSVSWTHGNHITKFGGEFAYQRGTLALSQNLNKGTLSFNTNTPALNAFATASALDNFMAGIVSSGTMQTGTVQRQFTYPQYAGYIQDDWRIFPRLTLNLGLRYEYESPAHEVNNLFGSIALGSPTGIIQQGQPGGSPLYRMDPWAFGPRFGLAWDVTGKGKTVVRTGFNIIYAQPFAGTLFGTAAGLQLVPTGLKLSNGAAVVNEGGTINLASLAINPPASPIPWAQGVSVFGNYVGASSSCSAALPCNIGGVQSHLEYPEVLNWNFGVQHAITNNLTLEVSYVGTHGQHLLSSADINQPLPGSSSKPQEQARRPFTSNGQYTWFGKMVVLGSVSDRSNYNALQVVARERVSHGLTFIASYTYSHALDNGSSDMSPTLPEDSRNPNAEYSNSAFDLRHRITFGPSYKLPNKAGYAQMLQGWQVTSSVFIDSGRPINAIDGVDDLSGTGEALDRWTLAGSPHDFSTQFGKTATIPCFAAAGASATWTSVCTAGLPQACVTAAANEQPGPGGTTGTASLNKLGCYMMGSSVIVPPAQGTFGTMSRYWLYGIGYWSWDMSIIKSWKIRERISTEFRAEIYNVTNSTRFAPPIATLNTPATFGQAQATPEIAANSPIIGTGGPRKIQLGLSFLF